MTITAAFVEENGLRVAFRTEVDAAATVLTMKARLVRAEAAAEGCRMVRANLPRRAALDSSVNGSDLRKADHALADAAAEVELLTLAIPHAVALARSAVQAAHAAAKTAAQRMLPAATADDLDAYFARHGRDRFVSDRVGRFELAAS